MMCRELVPLPKAYADRSARVRGFCQVPLSLAPQKTLHVIWILAGSLGLLVIPLLGAFGCL
jgi:hypothetical protein